MNTGLFDTHMHLTDKLYSKEDVDTIVKEAEALGVIRMINVGTCMETSELALEQAIRYDSVFCSAGIHPYEVTNGKTLTEEDERKITLWSKNKNFVAIGECGLDYSYKDKKDPEFKLIKNMQKKEFEKHIKLASKLNLPLIVHTRDSNEDTIAILSKYKGLVKGVIHCFTGTYEEAIKFISLGFLISFSGVLTFDKATDLRETAKKLELKHILLETDSPYLSPFPYRGKKNYPKYVKIVAQTLADTKKTNLNDIIKVTSANAARLFNI